MHLRCLQKNLVVTQEIVRDILSLLDPEGYHNKGPNYLWHTDSYDKLKPYGICINGCIDGYSRHIIWMRVGPTSSDPKVVAGYFVSAMRMVGGCPKTLRSDMGTENKIIEHIQRTFHTLFNTDRSEKPPYIYGKSTHNQRIEAWWSMLRKHCSQFWMNLFQSLKDDNDFEGGILDKLLMQFYYINRVILEWNAHKISKSRNSISPTERPTVLYEIPSWCGTVVSLVHVRTYIWNSHVDIYIRFVT
ncbi:hypothetical protein RI129_000756 [Pyrocoelia pectoralis]|uniref:Integrase core domain-containing protein n=1 Tax=Pyrocoelia pectoralis TaxID=417401 RepID=A0AAN7ZRB6_9COLE